MPAPDSPQVLIARYLQCNGYDKTLAAFLEETNLEPHNFEPKDPKTALTLEKVLDEKRLYDLSLKLEKIEISDDELDFTEPYPSVSTEVTTPEIKPSNILFVSVEPKLSPFEGPVLISTAADRSLRLYSALPPHTLLRSFTNPSDSAVLSVAVVDSKWLLVSTMNGRIDLLSADTGQSVSSIKPHQKYATRVLYHEPYVISAAYDKTIYMHTLTHDSETGHPVFSEEQVGKIDLPTPPEALALVDLPEGRGKAIVFSRRDSTSLFYNLLTPGLPVHSSRNLAPESTSWVSYHAMNISVHPTNPGLLAVATSTVPHMKFLLVEVDKEGVVKEMFTGAPQSPYSTGICVWRPDGSGVWLNADEGVVRGLEVKRGKVAARLQACAGGEKVRSLWAGEVEGLGEVLVTGGFDRGLRVWSVKGEKEVVDDADVGEER